VKRSINGFTIVELLIVIVVIAILASISLVAYNGIQTRAQNTRTITAAKEWVKLLNSYAVAKTDYLNLGPGNLACLGGLADYPASSEFAAGDCVDSWGKIDTLTNDELMSFARISASPWTYSLDEQWYWGGRIRGIQYSSNGIYPTGNSQWVVYSLKGDVGCSISNATKEAFNAGVTTCTVPVNLLIR